MDKHDREIPGLFLKKEFCLPLLHGTEQPNPSSIGTKLLPERPILRRNVSITKAILAIYPVSSNIDKKKNRIRITGRKLSTLPTPVNISINYKTFYHWINSIVCE